MDIRPGPYDSPEMVELTKAIDREWKRTVRLRKAEAASRKQEGLLRARLRLLQEGLVEGETLVMSPTGERGTLEASPDSPYLWLRLTSKSGAPTSKRRKIEVRTVVQRPDGSFPTPTRGHGEERQQIIARHHQN